MAAISINWGDLGEVAVVSLAFGVGITVMFAVGVLAVSRIEGIRDENGTATGQWYALAGIAFALCAAAVLYGLYLIIPQFH